MDVWFLTCLVSNISVHLYFLVKDTVQSTRKKCQKSKRKGCFCCKNRRSMLYKIEQKEVNTKKSATQLDVIAEEDEGLESDRAVHGKPVNMQDQIAKVQASQNLRLYGSTYQEPTPVSDIVTMRQAPVPLNFYGAANQSSLLKQEQ